MTPRSPRHQCARAFTRAGLFRQLGSFADLERRIEQLPTEKERGDAFEVFVEAYLSTDEMAQADEVWVVGQIPGEVGRKLNFPSKDYGFDGVVRTKLGELVPYQAKFRTGRAPLPYAELATFFGITEKADRRVVLTNSMAMSTVAESRTGFQTTRGGDFDRLDAAQLAAIAAWIDGVTPTPVIREPRPHQQAALADIQAELSAHDRATVVMACGTGKTLVALWAAERQQPKRVLVLVPSLSLLRQTLHEWAKWTNWGERFRYLCVCSDPKVAKGIDEIEIRPEDVDFPVMTDPGVVGRFLDHRNDAVSVVFCTYQSAPVIGAAMAGREPFDLGIFDEAHKTTGREGTRFAFALKDANLPIRKRLFMTATPRHYDIRKRDKEGDFAVASMNDEAVYGRVAHRLTFASAAAQKIIVPYKVVISVVDSEMIDNALLDQSEVIINGDPVRAKWVAHQIALKRAVEEHDLKRVISFHSSIKAAAAFASDDSEGVGVHLPSFQRFHVSGAQPTAEREEHMREFARVQRGVITNARCLTEGVDVPSVDMVAFMNPRRSRVDIVQAVGRAMRTAGADKTCGYVLIPLFLETRKGEALEDALERSDFDEVAQVLNAMRENDDELSDIIQTLNVERGRTGGFDESRLRDKVEVLGLRLQISDLATSIRTRIVAELGITWDERYGQLIAYKQAHGHCNVPQGWKGNPKLATWCNEQRTTFHRGSLATERIARLGQLGFVLDPQRSAWEEMFAALASFRDTYGHCNVPIEWKGNARLASWCVSQRTQFKRKTLSPDRVGRLNPLGFVWDQLEAAWDEMYEALAAYRQVHGDCNVPRVLVGESALASWCSFQRVRYKDNKLSDERVARLSRLGFLWDTRTAAWEEMFTALVQFKGAHGHCDVPQRWVDNRPLASWCDTQRMTYRKKTLSPERLERLHKLGFNWRPHDSAWEELFSALLEFRRMQGHSNVPSNWPDNPHLARWCNAQRSKYAKNILSPERVERLADVGFVWKARASAWDAMFDALREFKQIHGHCNVPSNWPDNPQLATWCSSQRSKCSTNSLSTERVERLAEMGFVWGARTNAWDEMFDALLSYRQIHGHCDVPRGWPDNRSLARWCDTQRQAFSKKVLAPDRMRRLLEIHFQFSLRGARKD